MMQLLLYYVVGVTIGMGFELVGGALDVFKGAEGFWCWLMTKFLDFVQESFEAGVELLPGLNLVTLDDFTRFATLFTGLNEIIPVYALGAIFLLWLSFQLVWIAIRTVLKLIPTIA